MIEIAIFGNSRTMRMNGSFEMRSAMSRSFARTVAARGALPRIPISPTKSLAPSVATTMGPAGVSRTTSASPSTMRYAASAGSPCRIKFFPGSKPTRSLTNANSFSFDGSISAKNGTRRSNSNSCLRLISSLLDLVLQPPCSFGCGQRQHRRTIPLQYRTPPGCLPFRVRPARFSALTILRLVALLHPDADLSPEWGCDLVSARPRIANEARQVIGTDEADLPENFMTRATAGSAHDSLSVAASWVLTRRDPLLTRNILAQCGFSNSRRVPTGTVVFLKDHFALMRLVQ